MTKSWKFSVSGSGADDATFEASGMIKCEFDRAFDEAMKESFLKLTRGEAVYGNPGRGGCRGPYDIRRVVIEQVIH